MTPEITYLTVAGDQRLNLSTSTENPAFFLCFHVE